MRSLLPLILLLTLPALAEQPKKRPDDHVQGKQLWERSCWYCHGDANDGAGPAAEGLVDPVPDLRGKVERGKFDAWVTLIMGGSPTHPAFGTEMDDNQARRILIYLEKMEKDRTAPEGEAPEEEEAPEEDAPEEDAPAN